MRMPPKNAGNIEHLYVKASGVWVEVHLDHLPDITVRVSSERGLRAWLGKLKKLFRRGKSS